MPAITPNLWFQIEAKDAAEFYVSVFPNSEITRISYYPESGPGPAGLPFLVDFTLDGRDFTAINGPGPDFRFNESISLLVDAPDQEAIDFYWDRLSEGGEEGQCGWLKDRYGVSWQIVPADAMREMQADPDPARVERAMQAVFTMQKLDLAAILAAADTA